MGETTGHEDTQDRSFQTTFVDAYFNLLIQKAITENPSLADELRQHCTGNTKLIDVVIDHTGIAVNTLSQGYEKLNRGNTRTVARGFQCAASGSNRLMSVLNATRLLRIGTGQIPPTEPARTLLSTAQRSLLTDKSGFSLVDRVVRETYDPEVTHPLGIPRPPHMIPPKNELNVTQLGLSRTGEIYKAIYMIGAQAGLGPMPPVAA